MVVALSAQTSDSTGYLLCRYSSSVSRRYRGENIVLDEICTYLLSKVRQRIQASTHVADRIS